ncbi:MAG: transcription termination factor Rho [Planctomycetota bacterium]
MSTHTANGDSTRGILELHPDGYGFLRNITQHYEVRPGDAYVSSDMIRRFELREGIYLAGPVQAASAEPEMQDRRPPPHRRNQRFQRGNQRNNQQRGGGRRQGPRLSAITEIEGVEPDQYKGRPSFDRLTPVDPHAWLRLETTAERLTTRVIDMFTPIGKGQRGLIVAPPRTGKTILMQHLAEGISTNHPEVELIVLLVDERPEEVTEMRRSIKGTVYASSNDRETSSHVRLAQLVIERSKRLVEMGKDVVVLLDSITRLARAYNKHVGTTGRTMSGGLDVKALDVPKRLFGSARASDEGGSLTVMATALIETGSRMDDVIFQEFKGTGNMELVLDRKLADRRVFPAIDILQSGTRKEERLLPAEMLERITLLRRSLTQMNDVEAMESLLTQLRKFPSNTEFLASIGRFLK